MKLERLSLIGLAAILLAACSGSPVVGPVSSLTREAEALAAVERGDFVAAERAYSALVAGTQGSERSRFQIALATMEAELGRPDAAVATLDSIQRPVPADLESDYSAARARAYFSLGRTAEAIRLLLEREIWLETSAEILDNQAKIWDGLSEPMSQTAVNLRTGDTTIDGWLALAPLTRITDDETRFQDALIIWRDEFASHPAARGILTERMSALRGRGVRPTKIAILLPLSSEVSASAEAILDGFFAAHLQSAFVDQVSIRVYDTTQRGSVESFFSAQLEGADFVVGPLIDVDVEDVQRQAGFIPTLALNLGDPAFDSAPNFYQFALSSDDEVDAIAARAIADGHRTAAILYSSSDRGYSQRDRFRNAFEARGGRVIEEAAYVRDEQIFTTPIEEILNIAASETRHNRLQANLGRTIEFEPRRRADIDMIFLQVEPIDGDVDARLLVPLLGANNAGPRDLPTFATRDVYDPGRGGGDTDLDGLVFPDVPLLIDPDGSARMARDLLDQFSTPAADQSRRLFAFGFDAYQLVNALHSAGDANWPISGATGDLFLGDNGRIRRVLPFAEFDGGLPRPLSPSVPPIDPR